MKKKQKKKAGAKKDKEETKPEASASKDDSEAAPPPNEEAADESADKTAAGDEAVEDPTSPGQTASQQSKLRSASFRAGSISGGPFSPGTEGETAADIYRKQVARIEDLEKENKRLAKEAADSEKRWEKAEEELTELKESDGKASGSDSAEITKLVRTLSRDIVHISISAANIGCL